MCFIPPGLNGLRIASASLLTGLHAPPSAVPEKTNLLEGVVNLVVGPQAARDWRAF
jgi:hypothetical protein